MNEIKKNLKIFVDGVKTSDVYLNYYKQKKNFKCKSGTAFASE